MEEKRIKLDAPVECNVKFTHMCTNCHTYLHNLDNFCPCCGENVSNCLSVVVLKSDGEQSSVTDDDALRFWEEDDSNG